MKDFMFLFRGPSPEDLNFTPEQHQAAIAVLGDLYGRAGNTAEARRLLEMAYHLTSSLAEKKLLLEKSAGLE